MLHYFIKYVTFYIITFIASIISWSDLQTQMGCVRYCHYVYTVIVIYVYMSQEKQYTRQYNTT